MKRVHEMIRSIFSCGLTVVLVLSFFRYYDNSSDFYQTWLFVLVVSITSLTLAGDIRKFFTIKKF